MTKGSTSVARKVLCSALSAAMVVAFAPAVGVAAGNSDGVAYAAEGEQTDDNANDTIDLGGSIYRAISRNGFWINPKMPENWKNCIGSFRISLTNNGNEQFLSSGADFEIDNWYTKANSEYQPLDSAPTEDGTYYLKINGKDAYTGIGYVEARVFTSTNLNAYPFGTSTKVLSDETEIINDPTKAVIKLRNNTNLAPLTQGKDFRVVGYSDNDTPQKGWLEPDGDNWQNDPTKLKPITSAEALEHAQKFLEKGYGYIYCLHIVGIGDYAGCEGYIESPIYSSKSFYGYKFSITGDNQGLTYIEEISSDPSSIKLTVERESSEGATPTQGTDFVVDNKWYCFDKATNKYVAYVDEDGHAIKPEKAGRDYFIKILKKDDSGYIGFEDNGAAGYLSVNLANYRNINDSRMNILQQENGAIWTSDLKTVPELEVTYQGNKLTKDTEYTASWAKLRDGAEDNLMPENYQATDCAVNGTNYILVSGIENQHYSGSKVERVKVQDLNNLSNYCAF